MLFIRAIILFCAISFTSVLVAQCPLNLGETPTVSDSGLVLYFPFNGNVQNYGSGSNTATLSGALFSNGICGQALHFDGFNDYVEINPFIDMLGDFTISTWIYLDTLIYEQEIFTTREQCQSTYRRYSQVELAVNHNQPSSGLQVDRILYMVNHHQNCTGYAVGDRYEPPNITYNSGNWFFLTVTIKDNEIESRIVNFYLNCQQLSSSMFANTNTAFLFNSGFNYTTYIGGGPNIGSYHYSLDGKIDEFRLYNRVLSQNEILDLYYKCKPLDISVNIGVSCLGDSAIIQLNNSQNSMLYYLFDSVSQQNIGISQIGGCDSIVFNTGLITTPSNIYIKAKNTLNGCITVLDTLVEINPNFNLSTYYDTLYACDGDSFLINGTFYFPPNIIIDTNISITGCDSIKVTTLEVEHLQKVEICDDTTICSNLDFVISLPNNYSYNWFNGSTNNSIIIQDSGLFWVKIDDGCNVYYEEFSIHYKECNCLMVVPNVFTPNNDGLNDFFYPKINCSFSYYHIYIYNRWGKLLFETEDETSKWDGTFNSKAAPDGVYFYLINYEKLITPGVRNQKTGSITILR